MQRFTNLVKTYTPKSLPSWRVGNGNTQGGEQGSANTGFSADRLSPRSISLSHLPARPSSTFEPDEDPDLQGFVLVGEMLETGSGADVTDADPGGDSIAPDKLDDKGKEPERKLPAKRDTASYTDSEGVEPDVDLIVDIDSSSSDEEPSDGTGMGPPPPDWNPGVPSLSVDQVVKSLPSGDVVAGNLSQALVNYTAGVGAFSGSFAIGGVLAAVLGLAHPVAAGLVYPIVAGPLHASVGESIAMMVRANWGSAYGSPCGAAWNAYSDALADLIAASIAGDPDAVGDAREKMNQQILKVWSIVHPDLPAPELSPDELRRDIISHATMARAAGIAFVTDELPFVWFALAYSMAGKAGFEMLRSIAQGAADWQMRETATFSMLNCINFLGFGALLGGAMTTVTQNLLRSYLPDVPPPTRGNNRGKVLDRKIAATQAKMAELQRIRDQDLNPLIQHFKAVADPSDEQVADLDRATRYRDTLEDALKGLEKELGRLNNVRQLSRRERDHATFSDTIKSLFTDPGKRFNQISKLCANVMCLAPYARQVVELNTANAQLARDLVAQTATSPQLLQVATLNQVAGPTLIGMWFLRMPLQLAAKVAYGVGSGVVQQLNKPAAPGATAPQTTTVADPERAQDEAENIPENVDGMDNKPSHETTSSSSSSATEDLEMPQRVVIEQGSEGSVEDRVTEVRFDDDMGEFVVIPPEDTGDDDMDQLVNKVKDLIGSHKSGQLSEIGQSIVNALIRQADADQPSGDGGSSDDPDKPD
jgi:hypothetical protein